MPEVGKDHNSTTPTTTHPNNNRTSHENNTITSDRNNHNTSFRHNTNTHSSNTHHEVYIPKHVIETQTTLNESNTNLNEYEHTNTLLTQIEEIPIINNNNNNNNIVEQMLNNTDNTTILPIILDEQTQNEITRFLINDIKGDTLDQKDKDQLRVIFQNINSLRPSTTDKWEATIKQMIEYHGDIVGLCETCCNWKDILLKKLFQIKANRLLKKS
jgi:hypothetical protein